MTQRQLKFGYFILEGTNSFATSFYFFYLFFLTKERFGFGNMENLALSGLHGFFYMFAAWYGGRFGQRRGYFNALTVGFGGMLVALTFGAFQSTLGGQIVCLLAWTLGMCFTWPTLEALVSEKEPPSRLPRMVGIYNLVWAGSSAVAYFLGGAIVETVGLQSLFWLPVGIHAGQLILLTFLRVQAKRVEAVMPSAVKDFRASAGGELNPRPIARVKTFLRLAWAANPFAYVAINTVAAVIPTLAQQFSLSPTLAGVFCSVWFFARWATFLVLWLWPGWHYRAGWFFGAFVLVIASFSTILLVPNLAIVVAAQTIFGAALGLLYYSSLFYSMDTSEAKGEHGGLHEAAIGIGIFLGPAVGATSLKLAPGHAHASTLAVAGLLGLGLVLLGVIWSRRG